MNRKTVFTPNLANDIRDDSFDDTFDDKSEHMLTSFIKLLFQRAEPRGSALPLYSGQRLTNVLTNTVHRMAIS